MTRITLHPPLITLAVLLSTVTCLISCKSKHTPAAEFIKAVPKIEVYNYTSWPQQYFDRDVDIRHFNITMLRFKGEDWYAYLKTNIRSLLLFNFNRPALVDTLPLPADSLPGSFLALEDSLLYVTSLKARKQAVYKYEQDRFTNIWKDSFISFDHKKYYHDFFGQVQAIGIEKPVVFIGFGTKYNPQLNYIHPDHNFMRLNHAADTPLLLGHYPADYFDAKQYNNNTVFTSDRREYIYYTFEVSDSIYKMDATGHILAAAALEKEQGFKPFDWKKEQDLAYVRKYELTTEMNLRVQWLNSNHIVVIKQLPKEDILQKSRYKYFVLDSNLQVKYADTVRHGLYQVFLGQYKNGFLLLSDSLKSAHYYEVY